MPLPLLALIACGPPPELVCEGAITVTVDAGDAVGPRRADLVLSGTATHSGGFAIRRVLVQGLAADNLGFNFDAWTVTVPIEVLVASAAAADDGDSPTATGTLAVEAVDACGEVHVLDPLTVDVDLTPDVVVGAGDLSVTVRAGEEGYLPADGSEVATVEVCAPADAVGVEVVLSSGEGSFLGLTDGHAELGLDETDGCAGAGVTVSFSPDTTRSTAFLSASAGGATSTAAIDVAVAPSLVPASASLAAGQGLVVQVLADGVVRTCTAFGADPASLEAEILSEDGSTTSLYDGIPLPATEPSTDYRLRLAAPAGASAAMVQVQCCDVFDQCSAPAIYSVIGA